MLTGVMDEADMLVAFKRPLVGSMHIQGMEGYGSYAGRQLMVFAPCSVQTLIPTWPVLVLYCCMFITGAFSEVYERIGLALNICKM